MELLPRSAWTAHAPIRKLTPLDAAKVLGISVHWPGSSGSWGQTPTKEQTAARLEAERLQHTSPSKTDTTKPWSDIAYCAAVDLSGRCWSLRGLGIRSAANGNRTTNDQYVAVTVLMGPDDTLTDAAVDGVRYVRSLALARYPHATEVVGHRDLHSTQCPGDRIYELIRSGAFTHPPAEEPDMPITDVEMDRLIERMAGNQKLLNAISAEVLGPQASYAVRIDDPAKAEVTLSDGAPAVSPITSMRMTLDEIRTVRTEVALLRKAVTDLAAASGADPKALAAAVGDELAVRLNSARPR